MNNRNIIGIMLIVAAVALACLISSPAGEPATRLLGKALWYLPYVAVVGSVRCFRAH